MRIEEHANNMPVQKVSSAIEMTNLEADRWSLLKQRIAYDLQVLRVAKSKVSTWESAHYHQQLAHRQQAWENSFRGAQAFFAANSLIATAGRTDDFLQQVAVFKDSWCRSNALRKEGLATWKIF